MCMLFSCSSVFISFQTQPETVRGLRKTLTPPTPIACYCLISLTQYLPTIFQVTMCLLYQSFYPSLSMRSIVPPRVLCICSFLFLKCFLLRYLHNLFFDFYLLSDVTEAQNILTQSEIAPVSSGVPNIFLHTIHLFFLNCYCISCQFKCKQHEDRTTSALHIAP